jgi:hypothetical protein
LLREVAEVATFAVVLGAPLVGPLDLRVLVARCSEEDEGAAALHAVLAPDLLQAVVVAAERERLVEVGDATMLCSDFT